MVKKVEYIQVKLLKCLFYTNMYCIVYTRISGRSVPFIISLLTYLAFIVCVQGLLNDASLSSKYGYKPFAQYLGQSI